MPYREEDQRPVILSVEQHIDKMWEDWEQWGGDMGELQQRLMERFGSPIPQTPQQVIEVSSELFDNNGRRIPHNLQSAVCDPNTDFHLIQPGINYDERLARFKELQDTNITSSEFKERIEQLLEGLGQDESVSNLRNAVHLPIILTRQEISDYGQALEELLELVGRAYENQFPGRKFYNHQKGTLKGQVSVVHDSHNRLLKRTRKEEVPALYFPHPLQGFSINASREQMATLPKNILLTGGLDTATVMAMYPDILARDWHTPGLDLAALSWKSSSQSLYFEALDGRLDFDYDDDLAWAHDNSSGGLLLL